MRTVRSGRWIAGIGAERFREGGGGGCKRKQQQNA
jgi:hypothetical protein